MEQFFHISFLVCLGYFLAVNAYYFLILITSWLENRLRSRQAERDSFDLFQASEFTIPVSVIIPAFNERSVILDTVFAVLASEYPHFEVIVINDGSTDGTLELLQDEFSLEPTTRFYRQIIPTRKVKGIYRSRTLPRLTVVDKVNGGTHADAANVGLNLAKYRYVLSVDADTVVEKDAIMKSIRLVLRNPKEVVGVGSLIGISNGLTVNHGRIENYGISRQITANLQVIEYLRAFLVNRLGWSRGNHNMCVSGAFSLWRRDVLIEVGGFQRGFSCDDLEMTFRVHQHFRKKKIPYQILSLPDPVCWTEAPTKTYALYQQRHRWQRVMNETSFHYLRVLFNPRYGTVGLLGAPYILLAEVLGPWIELFSYILIPLGWWMGALSFEHLGFFLLCSAGLTYLLSTLALFLFDSSHPLFNGKGVVRLSIASAAEFLGFRQTISIARFMGTIASFFGVKSWNKFERERRSPA